MTAAVRTRAGTSGPGTADDDDGDAKLTAGRSAVFGCCRGRRRTSRTAEEEDDSGGGGGRRG
jgi:hypothetical protein